MTQSEKSTKVAMLDQQINKLELQIAKLQKQKELINKQTTVQEFKLSAFIKSLLEAPDPEDAPNTGDENPEDTEDTGADDSTEKKDAPAKSNLQVKFNMSNAKKYNKYPVVDNTGTVTGVSKEGITVLVGDSTIFVSYKDILT